MAEEGGKTMSLVILGIVSVVAIIGLVLLFRGGTGTGAATFGRQAIGECYMDRSAYMEGNPQGDYVYDAQPVFSERQLEIIQARGYTCELY